MTLPFTTFPIPTVLLDNVSVLATNTTVANTLANRFGGLSTPFSVKDFGATGDGTTDDTAAIQAAINTVFPPNTNALNPTNKGMLYFPPGNYKITAALTLTNVASAVISGAGPGTSQITQATSGLAVFKTNGFAFSTIEQLLLKMSTNGIGIDYDWDGSQPVNSQEVTFNKLFFSGANSGDIGLRIGQSGFQCSENVIRDCDFGNIAVAAIKTNNFNALGNQIYGGNIINCTGIGIWVFKGSIPTIIGVNFENGNSNSWDIQIDNGTGDAYQISGCRSESLNFLTAPFGSPVLTGCEHTPAATGTFVKSGAHPVTLINCIGGNGVAGTGPVLNAAGQPITVIGCNFTQPLSAMSGILTVINSWFNQTGDAGGGTFYKSITQQWNVGNFPNSGNGNLSEIVGDGNSFNAIGSISLNGNATGIQQFLTRGAAPTTQTIVQNGDVLGNMNGWGSDGTAYKLSSGINYEVDGAPGAGSMPGRIVFYTVPSGTTSLANRGRIDNKGSWAVGNGAIATIATDGFLYIPACAGPPTGVPTAYTGRVPMVYDSTNNKFYIYNGGWKGGTNPGAFT
jgi:hypothetical protein